jgi:hypothetical protein
MRLKRAYVQLLDFAFSCVSMRCSMMFEWLNLSGLVVAFRFVCGELVVGFWSIYADFGAFWVGLWVNSGEFAVDLPVILLLILIYRG